MFVELMPLLAGRTVMITVAREDEKTVRVCVIPKKVKEDDHPALTTPLSYTGTPEELDAELGKHLASYVECHTLTITHPLHHQSSEEHVTLRIGLLNKEYHCRADRQKSYALLKNIHATPPSFVPNS